MAAPPATEIIVSIVVRGSTDVEILSGDRLVHV
jgi:hypothetical protein